MFHRYLEISVLAGDRLLLLLKVSENLRQSTLRRKGAGVRRTRRSNRKLALEQDHTVVDVLCLCDRKKLRMHLLAVEGKERIRWRIVHRSVPLTRPRQRYLGVRIQLAIAIAASALAVDQRGHCEQKSRTWKEDPHRSCPLALETKGAGPWCQGSALEQVRQLRGISPS